MKSSLQKIEKRLAAVLRKEIFARLITGFSRVVIIASALWFMLTLLELAGEFSSATRTVLFWGYIALVILAAIFFLKPVYKLITKPDYHRAANMVGEHFAGIKDELLNALQLLDSGTDAGNPLTGAAFNRVYDKTRDLNFTGIVNLTPAVRRLITAFVISVVLFALVGYVPAFGSASHRMLNCAIEFKPAPKIVFNVKPGNTTITKGEDVKIVTAVAGERPGYIMFHSKSEEQTEFGAVKLLPDSLVQFIHTLRKVRSKVEYYVSADGIESGVYTITVIDPPIIIKLEVTVTPPAYSGQAISFQKDNGNITTLSGSYLNLTVSSSKPLSRAEIIFGDSTKLPLNINMAKASKRFRVMKDNEYYIDLTDTGNNRNVNPVIYNIKITEDVYPGIEIVSPEEEIELSASTNVPVTLKIWDDYGFDKLTHNYQLASSKYEEPWDEPRAEIITINKNLFEQDVYTVWDISQLALAEGDVITYYYEIYDNDNVNGPKSTRSKTYTMRVPSIDDLFDNLDKEQAETETGLEKLLDDAAELKKDFENLANELKKDAKEIEWEEKEKIDKALKKFQDMTTKMDDLKEKVSEMKKNAMQNNLLSEETLEKYNELQKLMDELNSDQMSEAFKKMQQMMEQLSRNQVQQSLENIKQNEEYFKKSIERTINLLKKIQIEQKVDELIKRTEELADKLKKVSEKTEQSSLNDKSASDELNKRQRDITEGIDKIDDVMKELAGKMCGMKDMPEDELKKLMEEFEKQQNKNLSKDAEQNLQSENKPSAMKNQQKLSSNMKMLSEMMKSMQQSLMMQNQMQVMYDMLKIIDNLLILSGEEEKLKNENGGMNSMSDDFVQSTRKQNQLITSLDKVTKQMSDLSQKTFAVTPEMGNAIGTARANMQQAINMLQYRRGATAVKFQIDAMKYLNETALLMKRALDMLMSGGGGGGMMSLMQQLQQMADQQMNLNQLTKMLNQGNLSQQQMAQLQRLANEQAQLRKSLAQLNRESKEAGHSKKLAGNLEKILGEMKEVVSKLKSNKIDDDLVLKQERILSRLLDTQRSMNERDFDENRESESGRNIVRQSPDNPEYSSGAKEKLRDELIRALKEGYKKDYEELIRKYFEALEEEKY